MLGTHGLVNNQYCQRWRNGTQLGINCVKGELSVGEAGESVNPKTRLIPDRQFVLPLSRSHVVAFERCCSRSRIYSILMENVCTSEGVKHDDERPIDSYTSSVSLAVDFLIGSPGYRVTTTRIDRPLMLSPPTVIMHKIYYV